MVACSQRLRHLSSASSAACVSSMSVMCGSSVMVPGGRGLRRSKPSSATRWSSRSMRSAPCSEKRRRTLMMLSAPKSGSARSEARSSCADETRPASATAFMEALCAAVTPSGSAVKTAHLLGGRSIFIAALKKRCALLSIPSSAHTIAVKYPDRPIRSSTSATVARSNPAAATAHGMLLLWSAASQRRIPSGGSRTSSTNERYSHAAL
mmetsp:Transcript_15821/g.51834  ORF Transcript_15821/g.51834 Transcript_15821/m.51834 type:complete len:208 (+) Transcript_15821:115-738(+)